jgi:transposase
LVARDRG